MAPGAAVGAGTIRAMAPPADVDSGAPDDRMQKIVNLSKRRGFVFPSAEIYGGFRSAYDYGPIGVLLLRNVKDAWWRSMVQLRTDVVGLDAADPLAARGLGGLGPPGQLHRSAGRLPGVPVPLAPRQARGPGGLPAVRGQGQLHRGPGLQPDVQDPGRPGGG